MAKSVIEPKIDARPARVDAAPLSAGVRRHLGQSLRTFYAASLSEPVTGPVSERLEALLAKLDPKG